MSWRTGFEIPLTPGNASSSLEFTDSIRYKVIGFPLGRLPSVGDVFPGFFRLLCCFRGWWLVGEPLNPKV